MRSKTTTNSAPRAAVTLSKQRPRPCVRITRSTSPIKPSQRTTGRPQTAPERRETGVYAHARPHTHTHTHRLGLERSYSQISAPSQCLRSPTPTDSETPCSKRVRGSRVAGSRPGAIVTFSCTGWFVWLFKINHRTCEMGGGGGGGGNEALQWLPLLRLHFGNYCNRAQETLLIKNKCSNCRVS